MNWRDAIVEGKMVTAGEQAAAFANWIERRELTYPELQAQLRRQGVPLTCADRAADRMLQKARKAGVIRHVGGGKWEVAA